MSKKYKDLTLKQLEEEYVRMKTFALGYDEEEKKQIRALRTKINVLKSSIYGWK